MAFFDGLIFNMDRHEHNFGILRDTETGRILGMAPLYDHNIALITRGFPSDICRDRDRLIEDFVQLVKGENIRFTLPILTEKMVTRALDKTAGFFDALPGNTTQFVKEYIIIGYKQIKERSTLPVKKAERNEPER
jgi:hypothetical protein